MNTFPLFRFLVILVSFCVTSNSIMAQLKDELFTEESYYKIKWGYANEFIELWKKNHYPLMKKAQENGDILSITAEKPILHSSEDIRWDFKVTVVYKNSEVGLDHGIIDKYKKGLYPDLEKLKKEEQHRFELLLAHWDILTEKVELK